MPKVPKVPKVHVEQALEAWTELGLCSDWLTLQLGVDIMSLEPFVCMSSPVDYHRLQGTTFSIDNYPRSQSLCLSVSVPGRRLAWIPVDTSDASAQDSGSKDK